MSSVAASNSERFKAEERAELDAARAEIARLSQLLVEADALAGVGALLPGMAHELNTPLGNAVTTASLLQDRTRELARFIDEGTLRRSTLAAYVQDMHMGVDILHRSLQSAFELVAHIKQMSVDQASHRRRVFALAGVVDDVLSVLGRRIARAGCAVEAAAGLCRELDSYPGPLGQILMNLVQNALIHGLAGRSDGRICIAARDRDGERFELVIEDNGRGMTPEVRSHAFEPYFTTRASEGGSGLGLHIVRELVGGTLGGELALQTAPGQGCRFTLLLPYRAPQLPT
jgi:signal transduction histidine kinase